MNNNTKQNPLAEVAARIKEMREIMGWSITEMAEKTEVTEAEYNEYESGKKDFPFVVLMDDYLISQVIPEHPVLRRREPEAGALAVKMLMAKGRACRHKAADCH